jgi:hypothetical protein
MKGFWPRLIAVPGPFSLGWISMIRIWFAGPRFVIMYYSEGLAVTMIAALVASSVYNIEMSLTYKSFRIPSRQR